MDVAEIGFGTAPLGGLFERVAEQDALAALDTAYAAGVRIFDTAPHYGGGLAEERLGRFLSTVDATDCVVSTKVGRLLDVDQDGTAPDRFVGGHQVRRWFDFSRDGIRRSLDSSLTRLGLDHVGIAYLHDPESAMGSAIGTGVDALHELKDEGVIGAVGVGTNIVDVARRFVSSGGIDSVMLAGRLTLLDQTGLELVNICAQRSVSVHAVGAFNSGVLADPVDGAHFDYEPASDEILTRARALETACADHGLSIADVAVRYPTLFPAVEHVVLGLRSVAEAEVAIASAAKSMPEQLWTDLGDMGVPMPGDAVNQDDTDLNQTSFR